MKPSSLAALAAAVFTLSACTPPVRPDGADTARAELRALQADARLAAHLPPLAEAEAAVTAAELPTRDLPAGQHAAYVAQRKVAIARAQAEKTLGDTRLAAMRKQRNDIEADTRVLGAEIAQNQAEAAAIALAAQQAAARQAQLDAVAAQQATDELRRQMQLLQAEMSDRGMVMTLGDVLFASGKADLQAGAEERLDALAAFLHRYTDRTLLIEGHTDTQGDDEKNLVLSQKRAEAVKVYLIIQSIDAARLVAIGRGSEAAIADNASAEGRQRNRRVEIVIRTPEPATP